MLTVSVGSLLAVTEALLFLEGDVELNPGPRNIPTVGDTFHRLQFMIEKLV